MGLNFTYGRHLEVAKLIPQVFDGVQSNQRSDEEPDQFNTSNTANAEPRHEQPEEPFRLEALVLQSVEFGPAKNSSHGTREEHGVEKDEAADGRVRVLAEDHQRNEPDRRTPQVELLSGPVGHGNTDGAEEGVELAHKGVVDIFGVSLAGLELERAVVTCKVARQTDE